MELSHNIIELIFLQKNFIEKRSEIDEIVTLRGQLINLRTRIVSEQRDTVNKII